MKKKIILAATIAGYISTLCLANQVVDIYLENHYGKTVACKINGQEEIRIESDYNPVLLGSTDTLKTLTIRTTGYGSSYASSETPLNDFLWQIDSGKYARPNKDAVLIVDPSGYFENWKIKQIWRSKDASIESFSMKPIPETPEEKFLSVQSAQDRLLLIQAGVLGPEAARQTSEICQANYTGAVKLGKINLCDNLTRNIIAPQFFIIPKKAAAGLTKEDLAPTINEIKDTIATLHRSLEKYRKNGWASP